MSSKQARGLKDIGEWGPLERDPLAILAQQEVTRLPGLLPERHRRMAESPFAFYRGAAAVMAADLAQAPHRGEHVLSCGDAHLSNFGLFATPERRLAFDVNDFDEGAFAPWDWDLKRLLTSIILAARQNGVGDEDAWEAARRSARAYRKSLRGFMEMNAIDRFYAGVNTDELESVLKRAAAGEGKRKVKGAKEAAKELSKAAAKARKHTSARALAALQIEETEAGPRLVDQPPLAQHTEDMSLDAARALFRSYLGTVDEDIKTLLSGFVLQDVMLRVVGVGSVGTRCFIALLQDGQGTRFIMQFKEASRSVLAEYGGIEQPRAQRRGQHGHRVVGAQRVLQAYSDRFLGYARGQADENSGGEAVDFYWRQFKDMKGGFDLGTLDLDALNLLSTTCAALLARSHAQSTSAADVAPALKGRRDVDAALAGAAMDYANQTIKDHTALVAAIDAGKVTSVKR